MAVISIGNSATNRASSKTFGLTIIDLNVPCSGKGAIFEVRIWAVSNLTNCKVGLFRLVSGTTYQCISTYTIGSVTGGSEQIKVVELPNAQAGDFIGIYYTAGGLERTNSGSMMELAGDQMTAGASAVYGSSIGVLSLGGFGVSGVPDDFSNTSEVGREEATFEFGQPIENGSGVVEIAVGVEEEINETPFIESIQSGDSIILKAPKYVSGKVFSFWRIIFQDGSQQIVEGNELEYQVTQEIEVRAIYSSLQFRYSVSLVAGPTGFTNESVMREEVVLTVL